jgi:signal transduction histidine kinase
MELVAQWSSMLVHDLKNYLTPVRLVARNLVSFKDRPDVIVKASQDLDTVVLHMQALMQKLSKLRHQPRAGMGLVDLGAVTSTALDKLMVARDGLTVESELQPALRVAGDEEMLRRVLDNLLTNAVEAMQDGGVLKVDGRLLDGPTAPARVCLTVADTGCGMPPQFLEQRLFRPFATTKESGLGLGLYQSRAIVRAHGGDLTIESTPQVGTTARVLLPAAGRGDERSLEAGEMAGAGA